MSWGLRRSKYNAVKAADGFPSRLEAAVYGQLCLREKAGEIGDLKRQQIVVLQDGPRDMRISWRVDFSFVDMKSGRLTYVEAKGFETAEYKLKLKLWRKLRPADLEIWKGTSQRPVLVETIKGE